MTDAPQRIWMWTTGIQRIADKNGLEERPFYNEGRTTEYIRADIAKAEIERLRAALDAAEAEAAVAENARLREALTSIRRLARLVANDLQGRVETGKVAAVQNCADIADAALTKENPNG